MLQLAQKVLAKAPMVWTPPTRRVEALPASKGDDIGWMYRRLSGPEPGEATRQWQNERRSRAKKTEVRGKQ
jgi:hypothetical protein